MLAGVADPPARLVGLTLTERITENGHVLPGVASATSTSAGCPSRRRTRRGPAAARRSSRAHPSTCAPATTELSVDPTALGLQVDAAASVRAAREAGRSRNPLDQLSGTVLRRVPRRPGPVRRRRGPRPLRRRPRRLGRADRQGPRRRRAPLRGHHRWSRSRRSPASASSGTRRRPRSSPRSAEGRATPGASPSARRRRRSTRHDVARAAARARAVLAATGHRHGNATPLLLTPEQVAPTLSTEIDKSKLVLKSDPAEAAGRVRRAGSRRSRPRPRTRASRSTAPRSPSSRPSPASSSTSTSSAKQIARGHHAFVGEDRRTCSPRAPPSGRRSSTSRSSCRASRRTTVPGQPRVTNIHRAADVINGTIVPPGDTFSLNAALGPRTVDEGLRPGAPDRCRPRVRGRGRRRGQPGLDHALQRDVLRLLPGRDPHACTRSTSPGTRWDGRRRCNYPSIDNQFKNDSASGVLIRAFYSSGSVTVAFYGNKGGRSCRAEGPHILQTIPSETEYVDDPSLPAGQTKTLESGHTRVRGRELPDHQHARPARTSASATWSATRRRRRRSPGAPAARPSPP